MKKKRNEEIYAEYRKGKTLSEIGALYNITRERVRQIVNTEKANDADAHWEDRFSPEIRRVLIQNKITNEQELLDAVECGKIKLSKRGIEKCNAIIKTAIVIPKKPHPRFIDISGKKYGRLTAIEPNGRRCGVITWKCKSDCGNVVTVRGDNLRKGLSKSCGCWKSDRLRIINGMRGYALKKCGYIYSNISINEKESEE